MQKIDQKKLYRTVDANFNRAKEGLRVCEDICRFILNRRKGTAHYKALRHELTTIVGSWKFFQLTRARDTAHDVGRRSTAVELKRKNFSDIYYANSQRVKESVRVLEEFAKLTNTQSAQRLKKIRYKIYVLEKEIIKHL